MLPAADTTGLTVSDASIWVPLLAAVAQRTFLFEPVELESTRHEIKTIEIGW